MDGREKAFQKKLLATFAVEAAEHLKTLTAGLVRLEGSLGAEERTQVLESVYRGVHSFKGAARAVGETAIEGVCQAAEGVFAGLRQGTLALSPALFDLLHETADALATCVAGMGTDGAGAPSVPDPDLVERLRRAARGEAAVAREPARPHSAEGPGAADTVRIASGRLDRLLRQAEELLSAKAASAARGAEIRAALAEARAAARSPGGAKALEARLETLAKSTEQDRRALFAMVDNLLDDMKKALMMPASSMLEGLPKMARDLSRSEGKEVELSVSGADIEIDRRILEELRDPLVHIIRNAIDHGIEAPQIRERAGKPRRGSVRLAVTQLAGSKVEIRVSDDGAGIDATKVREAALKLGVLGDGDAAAGAAGILPLVFQSGLSTSAIITDLSGRGLGLAIVWDKVERLGGTVEVASEPGQGTSFRMILPLTLAAFRGVQVRAGEHRFVVPAPNVEQCLRVKREMVKSVENRQTIPWNGQTVALVDLRQALEFPPANEERAAGDWVQALVLAAAGKRVAFEVDEILGEQEVLVKGLGRQLARVRNVAGATVLGTGKVLPILHVPDLLQSAAKAASAPRPSAAAQLPAAVQARSILVAEDSITSRALLKSILEAAGYRVTAAVDGREAITLLKTGRFDLVVSDVEMPRMDGFELTARIRADPALARMPVVLVTGLESREHRERGVEAGADAYVVKSSFDQGNLLEILRRLLR